EPLVLMYIGVSYLNAEKLNDAQSYLEKALSIDSHYYTHQGMGRLLLLRGNFAGAINELERALRLLPNVQGSYLLAEAYLGNGESDSAASLFEQVADADPDGKLGKAATRRLRNVKKHAPSPVAPAGQQ
ncbi:MAG: tetratricopeptide repeat protein, partial [Deltaproteobacteria bacterium]|nr:tetratricopeptide repeat protein [Deltaproteobacteria bacterium]